MYKDSETKAESIQNGSDYDLKEDKIVIPRDRHKKGSVYERDGSFYDEDGNFLYRVP